MRKSWVVTLVLVGAGVVLGAQARNALNLLVNGPDANGNLPIGLMAYGGQGGPAKTLGNLLLKQDGLGNLSVAVAGVNGVATVAPGVPGILASSESTGNTAAVSNAINYTPAAAPGTYAVTGVVNVTAWTTPASFTVAVTYKDASGNARTDTAFLTRGSNGGSAAAVTAVDRWYVSLPAVDIDNSATAITVSTTGTFTGTPVYNLAAVLTQVR